ncbi:hypothetical protein [Sphingomicrobium clamense]|uniref:DUF2157 domain-containing protein n=1 Tax=Sphingomicrobium clamense TaxID=2851013 RepID=A0ABS6V4Y4_9SPHN|nr:hypothetical protein [Sphingomicrobium sp. B8]MBW0144615.1 hypothetical protein [Sphingomicrobium sp. B8]
MYSQQEIDDAVTAGAITQGSADALRAYVAQARSTPTVDQEHFRFILGFNDIFVSIATVILFVAVTWIGQSVGQSMGLTVDTDGPSPVAGIAMAAVAWGLATYFTAKKRMALPSIVLLGGFVGGVFTAVGSALAMIVEAGGSEPSEMIGGILIAITFAVTAGAAWLHWKTFKVPITVAAGAVAVAGIVAGLIGAGLASAGLEGDAFANAMLAIVLALGIAIFIYAMRWDASDPDRITRRSDVAFWLHLAAAVMIVHPVFTLLGLRDGDASMGEGLLAVGLYVLLGLLALAIDRRAMLVSALAYVLWALSDLFERFGAVELNVALTALVIGSALLLLSAFWHQARIRVVSMLPASLTAKLPSLEGAKAISPEPVG